MNDFTPQPEEKNPLKKWVILLGILTFLFFFTTLYFGYFAKPVFNQEYCKTVFEKEFLQNELDSLLVEHTRIKDEYGDFTTQLSEKDSIIIANAAEIQKMIESQADYNKIKKQLLRLQNIAKDYVDQIDQLYTENKALKEENIQVKATLVKSEQEKEIILKDVEDLKGKIDIAAVHRAYNINSRGVFYKNKGNIENITEKANRVEQIKISFILSENSLIPAGPLNIYCRIALPETGRILTPGSGDAYSFMYQGERLQFSIKKTINYTGATESVYLVWDLKTGDKAIKGKYIIQVYTDDTFLGESSFDLK